MKKPLIIGIVILVALVALVALLVTQRPATNEDILRNAILGSRSASCTIIDPDTDEEFEVMFKGGKTRMTGGTEEYEFFLIAGEENIYVWETITNEGLYFPITKSEEMGIHRFDDKEILFNDIKESAINCSAQTLPDELFDIPADISFYTEEEFFMRQFDLEDVDLDFDIDEVELDDIDEIELSEEELDY